MFGEKTTQSLESIYQFKLIYVTVVISFQGATKLYFMHYSCVVIIFSVWVCLSLHCLLTFLRN